MVAPQAVDNQVRITPPTRRGTSPRVNGESNRDGGPPQVVTVPVYADGIRNSRTLFVVSSIANVLLHHLFPRLSIAGMGGGRWLIREDGQCLI